jgi:Uma2 family endonuclease
MKTQDPATTAYSEPSPPLAAIVYPESDGKPMGETGFHIDNSVYLYDALRYYFRLEPKVYVAANMFLYYEEGDPSAVTAPDVFVVKGVNKHKRRTYKLWLEKVPPHVAFEVSSRKTRVEDFGSKRGIFEMLGVQEYFLFDPLEEYLKPPLQGFHLIDGRYQPVPANADGTLYSDELGLVLRPEIEFLRLVDPRTGQALPTMEEAMGLYIAAAERARAAEAELAGLRAELEKLRHDRS